VADILWIEAHEAEILALKSYVDETSRSNI